MPANTGKFGEFGWSGVLQGAGIIFFSYIGFDAASTTAREARNPQRDVPLGILGALGDFRRALRRDGRGYDRHGSVSRSSTSRAPVAVALDAHPQLAWLGGLVKLGAIVGMTSVILMSLLGQPRILLVDGGRRFAAERRWARCIPCIARRMSPPRGRCPRGASFAGLFPLNVLGELISIGILLAFTGVCIGVLVLRYTKPDAAALPRTVRTGDVRRSAR